MTPVRAFGAALLASVGMLAVAAARAAEPDVSVIRPGVSELVVAIGTRLSFNPDSLAVDLCSIRQVADSVSEAELRQYLRKVTFLECGEQAPRELTVWRLSDAMKFEGRLRTDLAADVSTARTSPREHYRIEEGRVIDLRLSAFGHYD